MGGVVPKTELDVVKEKTGLSTVFLTGIPKLGDKSQDVVRLQLRLNELAGARLKADGDFGKATASAVAVFQKSIGLTGSGVIGDKTLTGLVMAVLAPTKPVPDVKPLEPKWLTIARKEFGTKEGTHDKRIVEYHAATSLQAKSSSVAWCSSFANWCMKQAGIKGTNSAWARDWLTWGVKLDKPRIGCIVVFERNGSGGDSHVAFYLGETATHVSHLGGNQSNGVTETKTAKTALLGYRWPKEVATQPTSSIVVKHPKTPAEYSAKYNAAKLDADKLGIIKSTCDKILAARQIYENVEEVTKVPWYIVAVLHYRECSLNFKGHLHNGDPLTARTVHVPAKRPLRGNPPFTWYDSAIDALTYDGAHKWADWSIGGALQWIEPFNGLGYRNNNYDPSPYMWAGTDQSDETGKYTSDGKHDPDAQEKQLGIVAILKGLGIKA